MPRETIVAGSAPPVAGTVPTLWVDTSAAGPGLSGDGTTIQIVNGVISIIPGGVTTNEILDGTIVSGDIATFGVQNINVALASLSYNKIVAATSSPATIARIAAAGGQYGQVAGAPVIICTSSTRPASPAAGMCIYETDTDKTLFYQSATTGWTPPWNMAWGTIYRARLTNATSAIGTTEIDLWNSGAITYVANRAVAIIAHYYFTISVANIGFWVRYKIDGVWSVPNDSLFRADAYPSACLGHGECVWQPTAGAHTVTLSAGTLSGTATLRGDLMQGYWELRDVGPTANPV